MPGPDHELSGEAKKEHQLDMDIDDDDNEVTLDLKTYKKHCRKDVETVEYVEEVCKYWMQDYIRALSIDLEISFIFRA